MKRAIVALPLLAAACGSPQAKLTESQEYYAGRAMSAMLIRDYRLLNDPALTEYVNLVGYTVAMASDRPETFKGYTFGVLDSDVPNAIAGPSGFIFLTKGLVKMCRTEDELAAVLAHEVAHVVLKHPELALQKQLDDKGFMDTLNAGAGVASGVLGFLGKGQAADAVETARQNFGPYMRKVIENVVTKGYERNQEFEADLRGIDYLVREEAGYNPQALVDVLTRLADTPAKNDYGWLHGSTHPEPADRRDAAAAYLKEKAYPGATEPGRTQRFLEMTKGLK